MFPNEFQSLIECEVLWRAITILSSLYFFYFARKFLFILLYDSLLLFIYLDSDYPSGGYERKTQNISLSSMKQITLKLCPPKIACSITLIVGWTIKGLARAPQMAASGCSETHFSSDDDEA